MLKNKIDFIAKQCPVLYEYLDNLPPQHVNDFQAMGDEIKSFFDIKTENPIPFTSSRISKFFFDNIFPFNNEINSE